MPNNDNSNKSKHKTTPHEVHFCVDLKHEACFGSFFEENLFSLSQQESIANSFFIN